MIEQFKRRFNSLYWHQFALTAGMVLLTLLLLGVSFFTLSYGTTTADKRGEMRTRAELIAQVSADYFAAAGDASIDEGTALRKLADMASRMTDVDFLICSAQGNVLLTTDEELVGRSITIPQDIVDDILGKKALYQGRSNINGTYSVKKFAVAVPVLSSESQLVGIVLAVMDESEIMQVWRSFIGMFLMTSAIILLISFLASSVTSMRQIKPITDMVQATRAYAAGDFDVRIPELDRSDEIGELAQSFNAMADSLAETERQRRDFIANVSHELKTPMTTIAGYTDGILDGTIPPERERHYLQIISDESRRLSRLVRRMLDVTDFEQMTNLPQALRAQLAAHYSIAHVEIRRRLVSQIDGTVKYLYDMPDGETVESVLMQYKHGWSQCLSTQAGCRMGCAFCATGMGGLHRNLTASEMLSQVEVPFPPRGRRMLFFILLILFLCISANAAYSAD